MCSPERRKEYYPNQLREVNNACPVSGLELQAQLNAERCRIPIIFITAPGDEKMRLQAPSDGFHGGLNKSTQRHLIEGCLLKVVS
jgi:FixJ family two-component response regulator